MRALYRRVGVRQFDAQERCDNSTDLTSRAWRWIAPPSTSD